MYTTSRTQQTFKMVKFISFFFLSKATEARPEDEVDAMIQFQTMTDREALEFSVEVELDSDVSSAPEGMLPICAICRKNKKHEHDECVKKYNPMDKGYYDEEGGFVELTPPDHFVREAERLLKDPGPEGEHHRALQVYRQRAFQVELYLAAKQEKYGESAKGNGRYVKIS